MRKLLPLLLAAGFATCAISADPTLAQDKDKKKEKAPYAPPDKLFPPSADVMKQIETKTVQLAAKIEELRKNPKNVWLLPDVEIYLRGARNIVRFNEWFSKASGQWTLDVLDRGIERADQLAAGKSPWTTLEKRNVLRAYRSSVDGTAQPYGVTYPLEYGKDPKRKWRVDIVLHGRNSSLTEVAFINSHNGKKKIDPAQDWVQIDIFGRGNNAYRWSGESDVMEAKRAFFANEARRGADTSRVVLRGFSMGGAGTWHLGLHLPAEWCVMGPGAGFTTTHNYAWKGTKLLPDYQEKCLRIYDAVDYVENARMIPIVAYSGGDDPQKLAADNIEKRLKELKIDAMTHLVKPGVGHRFDPDYFQKANSLWSAHAKKSPGWQLRDRVSFTTYTTKYPMCNWVFIDYLERHYEKAQVDVQRTKDETRIATKNIAGLTLGGLPANQATRIVIDGQILNALVDPDQDVILVRVGPKWTTATIDDYHKEVKERPRKRWKVQGPIDDAFGSGTSGNGFVCVTGTGTTWHPATQQFVDAKVKAFEYDWAKHWRGELPITNEYGISPNEIREKHLILFGDPSSNFLLANILDKLPLKWTKDEIEFAGKKYKSSEHVPVMIFPNPLNPYKYVVLNTGHTFPSEDYAKTNALLYPRLGDYAILRMTPTAKNAAAYEVATAGLFDEFWRVEKK